MSDEIYDIEIYSRYRERCYELECKSFTHDGVKLDVDLDWLNFLNEADPSGELVKKKLTEVCTMLDVHGLEYEEEHCPVVTCYFTDEGIMNTRLIYAFYNNADGEVDGDHYDYVDIIYDITGYPFLDKLDHENYNPYYNEQYRRQIYGSYK